LAGKWQGIPEFTVQLTPDQTGIAFSFQFPQKFSASFSAEPCRLLFLKTSGSTDPVALVFADGGTKGHSGSLNASHQ
jgi:hypothetical protein